MLGPHQWYLPSPAWGWLWVGFSRPTTTPGAEERPLQSGMLQVPDHAGRQLALHTIFTSRQPFFTRRIPPEPDNWLEPKAVSSLCARRTVMFSPDPPKDVLGDSP